MAQADSGSVDHNQNQSREAYTSKNADIGSDVSENLGIAHYDAVELYSNSEHYSETADLYVLDPEIDHDEEAIKEFAGLFTDSDLLVPDSMYADIAWFIPDDTGFQADKHIETQWGYVEDEHEKYFLISDNQSK